MSKSNASIIEFIADELDIPPSAYEKAEERYKSIGAWLERPSSKCHGNSPHVHSQGSFRLGTVVKPLHEEDGFDLDMTCRLNDGISAETHSQRDLKSLVGDDLDSYCKGNGLKKPMEEKRRCWRLEYADELKFHVDVVPSIPDSMVRQVRKEMAIREFLGDPHISNEAARHALGITDTEEDDYEKLCAEWPHSNPEGYALWFEWRMRQAYRLMMKRALSESVASVDDLKPWNWRSPLQRAIQILKRHRDVMFKDRYDSKPISIIITTLAGHSYEGEETIEDTLDAVLGRMDRFVRDTAPYVPNPVNPNDEDFADKWDKPEYAKYQLRESFHEWLEQARKDFAFLGDKRHGFEQIKSGLKTRLGLSISEERINDLAVLIPAEPSYEPPKFEIHSGQKPWLATSDER